MKVKCICLKIHTNVNYARLWFFGTADNFIFVTYK